MNLLLIMHHTNYFILFYVFCSEFSNAFKNMKNVNWDRIKRVWYQSVSYGIDLSENLNILLCSGKKDLDETITKLQNIIKYKKSTNDIVININKERFHNIVNFGGWKRFHAIVNFEHKMHSLQNMCCHICKSVFVDYGVKQKYKLCISDQKKDTIEQYIRSSMDRQ